MDTNQPTTNKAMDMPFQKKLTTIANLETPVEEEDFQQFIFNQVTARETTNDETDFQQQLFDMVR